MEEGLLLTADFLSSNMDHLELTSQQLIHVYHKDQSKLPNN